MKAIKTDEKGIEKRKKLNNVGKMKEKYKRDKIIKKGGQEEARK